jgi:hypothetical protein
LKKLLLVTAIMAIAANVHAQTTKVELFADANGTSCELVDQGTALRSIYVFHTGTASSTGLRFKVSKPDCWLGATWVGDVSPFVTVGSSSLDWSVAYVACKTLPVYVGQINYFATGASLPCCEIVAQPAFQFVWTDCDFGEHPLVAGQKVVINANESCRCGGPLATETSTWGRVKSLYR